MAVLINTLIAMDSTADTAFGHDLVLILRVTALIACSTNKLNLFHCHSSFSYLFVKRMMKNHFQRKHVTPFFKQKGWLFVLLCGTHVN